MKVRETLRALRDQERAPGCTVKVGTVLLLSGVAMGRPFVANLRPVGRQFPGSLMLWSHQCLLRTPLQA